MATLYIHEFEGVGEFRGDSLYSPKEPHVAKQTVSVTGTSAQSAAFNSDTHLIRLLSDVDCFVEFGSSPTATTTSEFLSADVEYFRASGAGKKVAVRS